MNKRLFLAVSSALILAGCGDNSGKPQGTNTTSRSTSPMTAPADYVGGLGRAQQSAIKTTDTTSLQQAVQMFNVDNGRYPKDLNELVQQKYIPMIPAAPYGMKIVYDAGSGTVKVVNQ